MDIDETPAPKPIVKIKKTPSAYLTKSTEAVLNKVSFEGKSAKSRCHKNMPEEQVCKFNYQRETDRKTVLSKL